MSALAQWFHGRGKQVAGYDKTPSPITDMLSEMGMSVTFEDAIDTIPF